MKKTFAHVSPTAKFFLFAGMFMFFIISKIHKEMSPPVVRPALAVVPKTVTNEPMSDGARRVDALCASLPKPEKFELHSKTAPTETENFVSIAYTFRSSRPTSEIYPMFILWFAKNGWTDDKPADERLEFSRDAQTVRLAPFDMKKEGDFYTLNCTEWKVKPAKL